MPRAPSRLAVSIAFPQLSQLLRTLEEKNYLRVEERGTAREYYLSKVAALAYLSSHSHEPVMG